MNYAFHLLIYLEIFVLVASGLNVIVGYCGLLSMSQGAFFALGGYGFALASLRLGFGFPTALALACLVATISSLFLSIPARRARGDSFVLVSLALQSLLFTIAGNWHSTDADIGTIRNMTNGPFGIAGIPSPVVLSYTFDDASEYAALGAIVCMCALSLLWLTLSSPWGRLLRALRDDQLAARSLGKRVFAERSVAIALGCTLAAIGGALYAGYVGYIDPSAGSLDQSILFLSMVLLGGIQSFVGPFVGAGVVLLLPELLRQLGASSQLAASGRNIAVGVALCILVLARPQGLVGNYRLRS